MDARHSDAHLITDGTTDFGKKKINLTLGFGRISGDLKVDDSDRTKSSVEFHIYPATAMAEPIQEDGHFKTKWLANLANHTSDMFPLQKKGAEAGPVYGPPMTHNVSQEASFELEAASGQNSRKGGVFEASGSTSVTREGFPQMLKAVTTTYWPPLVQDENARRLPT